MLYLYDKVFEMLKFLWMRTETMRWDFDTRTACDFDKEVCLEKNIFRFLVYLMIDA